MDLKQQEVTSEALMRLFSELGLDDILKCHELAAKLIDMAARPADLVLCCAATMMLMLMLMLMLHLREKRVPFTPPMWYRVRGKRVCR